MQQRGKGSRRAARLLRARWPARCGCAGADEAAVAVAGYGSAGTGRGGRRPVSQMLKLSLSHPRTPKKEIRRSEEHTSELQSLMRISYAVFCLKKKKTQQIRDTTQVQKR